MKYVGKKNEPDIMTSVEVILPQEYSTHKLCISQWKKTGQKNLKQYYSDFSFDLRITYQVS